MRNLRRHASVSPLSATPVAAPSALARGRAGLLRTTALQSLVVLAFATPALSQPAPNARPTGGVVVGGAASIGQTAALTTVTQTTQRAAIDWRSFDVGAAHTVQFQQPGATAVVLNRVTGSDPSQIAGSIRANGQVVITNQSGVVFHQGAQVDAAGLVVSAAGISNPNFMAGRMVFDQAPRPDAMVSNAGTITIRQAGLAALVAPQVANSGVINARMGRVVLAGAETHTIDLYGDGLLSIDVTSQVRQAPRGPDGKPVSALVTNTGTVVADGGSVQLTAAAADGIVQTLVQAGGRLQANAAGGRSGTVLLAGVGGSVRIEGTVAANGGGTVSASASGPVTVAATARIRANGTAASPDGGTIQIGTRTTAATTVQAGAKLSASGRGTGNGGRVTLLSRGTTQFDGSVFARAGREGGNGGAVEISGQTVGLTGTVNAGAPHGKNGTLLLDPTDVTISDHGGTGTVVTPASLQGTTGDVTVQADNSIVADSSVALTGENQSLTLTAGNLVQVNTGVTLSSASGNLNLNSGAGGINLLGNLSAGTGLSLNATGPITQGAASSLKVPRFGDTAVTSRAGVDLQGAVSTGTLTFSVAGAVTQGTAGAIAASEVSGSVGSLSLTSRANQIAGLGTFSERALSATTGDISVVTSGSLQAGYFSGYSSNGVVVPDGHAITLTADTLSVQAQNPATSGLSAPNGTVALQPYTTGRRIQLVGTTAEQDAATLSLTQADLNGITAGTLRLGTATGGAVTLGNTSDAISLAGRVGVLNVLSAGAVSQDPTATLTVPTLTGTAASVALPGANGIATLGALATTGPLALNDAAALTVNGPVSAGGGASLSTTGAAGITLAGDLAAPSLSLTAGTGGTGGITQTAGIVTVPGPASFTAGGAINQTGGTMALGSLGGTSGGSVNLASPTNAIPVLTGFSAGGALAVATGGDLTLTGPLASPTSIRLDAGGDMLLAGTLTAQTVTLDAAGALTQPGGGINATILTGTSGSARFDLAANAVNGIGPYATTTGDFQLSTVSDLVVTGPVSAASGRTLTLLAPTLAFSSSGSLSAPGGTVAFVPNLAGGTFTVGSVTAAITADTLRLGAAGSGTISFTGAFNLPNVRTLSLVTSGAVVEAAGAGITVPRLTASGSSVRLDQANAIGTLGDVSVSGSFALASSTPLVVAGAVTAGGNISLTAPGLTLGTAALAGTLNTPAAVSLVAGTGATTEPNGAVTAGSLTGSGAAASLGGANSFGTLAGYTIVPGGSGLLLLNDVAPLTIVAPVVGATAATLQTAGSLTIGAPVSAGALSLVASSIQQTGGAVTASTLNVAAADAVLTGAIDTLGTVQVPGTFRLVDTAASLGTSGAVTVGTLDLTAGTVTFGPLTAGTLRLATGNVDQSGGLLQAGTLTGSSTGSLALGTGAGTANIGTLSGFDAAGSIALVNVAPLTVTGTIRTPLLTARAPGSLTLEGGVITADRSAFEVTNPVVSPPGQPVADAAAVPGVLTQTGTTVFAPRTNAGQLSLTVNGGTIVLSDLQAPGIGLTLAMGGGRATGALNVGSLQVNDRGGSAALTGTVGGRTGVDAATASTISQFDLAYTLNGCAIASASCLPNVMPPVTPPPVQPPTVTPPAATTPPSTAPAVTVRLAVPSTIRPDIALVRSSLRPDLFTADLVSVDMVRNPTDPEFTLPNISDRDY